MQAKGPGSRCPRLVQPAGAGDAAQQPTSQRCSPSLTGRPPKVLDYRLRTCSSRSGSWWSSVRTRWLALSRRYGRSDTS